MILTPVDPIYFSAIAVGKVHALEISKSDMMTKLPNLLLKQIERASWKRKEWFHIRLNTTKRAIRHLAKQSKTDVMFENEA